MTPPGAISDDSAVLVPAFSSSIQMLQPNEEYPMPVITPTHAPLSDSDIVQFERRFTINLPDTYRDFLRAYNGGKPLPKRFDTEDDKVSSMVARFFAMYDDEDDALEDEYTDITLDGVIPANLLPVAIDPARNRILLSLSGPDQGAVYYWSWDEEPEPATCSYRYMRRIAPDFDAFLAGLM